MLVENSTLLKEATYKDKGLLVVFKQGGTTWFYKGVPENEYDNMMKSQSIGSYFLKHIKPNYIGTKVKD